MSNDIPLDWRQRGVTSDDDLIPEEKETCMNFPNAEDYGRISTDIPTIIKWVQSVAESEPEDVRLNAEGEIVGVTARIPKAIVKLQASRRKSDSHSDMVSYGDSRTNE